jgi:hypothetical protein
MSPEEQRNIFVTRSLSDSKRERPNRFRVKETSVSPGYQAGCKKLAFRDRVTSERGEHAHEEAAALEGTQPTAFGLAQIEP